MDRRLWWWAGSWAKTPSRGRDVFTKTMLSSFKLSLAPVTLIHGLLGATGQAKTSGEEMALIFSRLKGHMGAPWV